MKFFLGDLGFDSFVDYITTVFGFKNNLLLPAAVLIGGGISIFIENHIWEDPAQLIFLLCLVVLDLLTGIAKSIKFRKQPDKKFRSRRIARTVGKILTYSIALFISFNFNKYLPELFFWMPYSFLAAFFVTEAWSIFENLTELGWLDKSTLQLLKDKLDLSKYFNKNKKEDN